MVKWIFGKDKMEQTPKDSVVRKIIIPEKLMNTAIEIGNKTIDEVGFYMIGFVEGNIAYIVDLIEFPYSEKSSLSVAATIEGQAKIGSITPLGLNVIGTMHKHPNGLGSQFSGIDRETYLRWAKVSDKSAHVIFSRGGKDISAYSVFKGDIRRIELEVRDTVKNMIDAYIVKLDTYFPLAISKGSSKIKMMNIIEKEIRSKILRRLSRYELETDENNLSIKIKPVVFVQLPERNNIIYEVTCGDEIKTVKDLKEVVKNLFNLEEDYAVKIEEEKLQDNQPIEPLRYKVIRFEESPKTIIKKLIEEKIEEIARTLRRELFQEIKALTKELASWKSDIEGLKDSLTEAIQEIRDQPDLLTKIENIERRIQHLETVQENIEAKISEIDERLSTQQTKEFLKEREKSEESCNETPNNEPNQKQKEN